MLYCSPRPRPAVRVALAVFVLACPALVLAQSADRVGIFFEPGYPTNVRDGDVLPINDTAYLVLLDPSQPDVGGWELRIETDGPAYVFGWQLSGQAVNFDTPPSFSVGLGSPLPGAPQVVLAQSGLLVTGPGPVTFSLVPTFRPSLPGEMVYIPFDDKELLTPLATYTGTPEVAWYNRDVPICDLSSPNLDFGVHGIGLITRRDLTVTNAGGGQLPVDVQLPADCPAFALIGPLDPQTLGPGESFTFGVTFEPDAVGEFQCTLDLGTGCNTVNLWGMGREPLRSLEIDPPLVDYGDVIIGGDSSPRTVHVRNTGEITVSLDFTPQPDCRDFAISPTSQLDLAPGSTLYVHTRFSPTRPDTQLCEMQLAADLDPLRLRGVGIYPADLIVEPPLLDFGAVYVNSGRTQSLSITNGGTVTRYLDLSLPVPCPPFTFWPLDISIDLLPGESLDMTVRFAPDQVGTWECDLALGQGLPVVPIVGTAIPLDDSVRTQPTAVTFGNVAVGSYADRTVTVINETGEIVTVTPAIATGQDGLDLVGSPAAITLAPGGRSVLLIRFQPVALGAHVDTLTLGVDLPVVPLSGTGAEAVDLWQVTPASIEFGDTYVGSFTNIDLYVTNNGNGSQVVSARVDDPLGPFLVGASDPQTLGPGETRRMFVHFSPDAPGVFSGNVVIDPAGTVPVTGTGVTDLPACFVHTTSLDFGTVLVGGTEPRSVHVTNTGNTGFDVDPAVNCPEFVYTGAPLHVAPGQTVELTVVFNPTATDQQVCAMDLGPVICSQVILTGEGSDSLVPNNDLVGVWFDTDLTTGIRSDVRVGEAVPAWLAMLNPSEPAGIGGWELRLDLGDGLFLTDYTLEGLAYNLEEAPEFFVGVADPLPWAPQVVLAQLAFLVTDTEMHAVDLLPVWRPSIPGHLAWVYGTEFQLKKMYPVSGMPSVAWLSASSPVAVVAPTPTATLDNGIVDLRWPLPVDDGEGCHVYRTLAGRESRLTAEPVRPAAGEYRYRDDATALPPGATVAYSYSIVNAGAEIARSPAVEVSLPGFGPMVTQLLPNRPNPFNPETEIPFALARPGHVRVTVFDVSGRRIATLLDEERAAGHGRAIWRGRDDWGRAMPSGSYYVTLETGTVRDTRKILLLK